MVPRTMQVGVWLLALIHFLPSWDLLDVCRQLCTWANDKHTQAPSSASGHSGSPVTVVTQEAGTTLPQDTAKALVTRYIVKTGRMN